MTVDIFQEATKQKLRFDSSIGDLSIEQLWDLPLTTTRNRPCLDAIAQAVNRQLRECSEESFVNSSPDPRKSELTLKLDILKAIIAAKQQENAAKTQRAQLESERERLRAILETKKAQALETLSVEEIEARLAAIG